MSQQRASEHPVVVDDRSLAVDDSGDPGGEPVFLLHGTPGSRSGPRPRDSVIYRLGVRLISYDRPGYGGSTRHEKRDVASAARDVAAIADALGIERFAVVGRSGGGPHALACAALLPDRITRTAVLVGIAPRDADLDWLDGMTDANVHDHTQAYDDSSRLVERLRLRADRTMSDPDSFLRVLREQMRHVDRQIVDDVVMQRLLSATYQEALQHGPYGWIDDLLAFREPWGFEIESIKSRVLLWHGADDNFSPVNHTRWLASKLPNCDLRIQRGAAHFGAMEVLPEVLVWLIDGDATDADDPAALDSALDRIGTPGLVPAESASP
ncbi:alpha/beta fold hydrolase [Virgisporangium aurantiacum]|uniref:Alpha/beta hydrolase n=1 Tax=Virgisporangium aurantiacum TaxID=175570 RepID=A0A8J3Z4G8_9ACTN|nr:alpha/beta hydrolase [Virgisporangium aurantiacum]GIJ57376.1 alpha/beta hydrolase [Virgisporangium aurantiacum]